MRCNCFCHQPALPDDTRDDIPCSVCQDNHRHKCDGGDDYGLVDCLKCEKEMLKALATTPNKKRDEIRDAS